MSNSPYKNMIPYAISKETYAGLAKACMDRAMELDSELIDQLEAHEAVDPPPTRWGSIGLVPPIPYSPALLDQAGSSFLMAIQFNDRILPAKVRNEYLLRRVTELVEREGRGLSKTEYAQLRDEVEYDLLPRAFIRRSIVHVMFTARSMYIHTSSVKRADDIVEFLLDIPGLIAPKGLRTHKTTHVPVETFLHGCVTDTPDNYEVVGQGVLKSSDGTIRLKGDRVTDDIHTLVVDEHYVPSELRLGWFDGDGDDALVEFTLTSGLVFKSIAVGGAHFETKGDPDDIISSFISATEITSRVLDDLTRDVISIQLNGSDGLAYGGARLEEKGESDDPTDSDDWLDDEDDEL